MEKRKFFNDYNVTLIIICGLFFFVYAFLVLSIWLPQYQKTGQLIYTWPDAMANQAFINQFIEKSTFVIDVPGNVALNDLIHPRSVNAYEGNLVPMTFLGFILIYGILGKIIGVAGTLFITPLLACLSVLTFYSLLKRVIKRSGAFISSLLLLTLAPFLYYATQVMLPQIAFITFVLLGLWFLTYKQTASTVKNYTLLAVGALLIGLALLIRTNEAPWVLGCCLILLIFFGKKNWYWKTAVFIGVFALVFLPAILLNKSLYGGYLNFGYFRLQEAGSVWQKLPTEFRVGGENSVLNFLKLVFLPFGFTPRLLWHNFVEYFWRFFSPYLCLSLAGLIALFIDKKNITRRHLAYVACAVWSAAWLLIYYGNWQFSDSLVLTQNTIGSSYMRYWLPLYMLFLPGIGYLFTRLRKSFVPKWLTYVVSVICVIGLSYYSYWWAVQTPSDGLRAISGHLEQYYTRYEMVDSRIEKNSIIIVDRMDKVFFPKYRVVVFLENYDIYPRLEKILEQQPIYYFSDKKVEDIQAINESSLQNVGLRFKEFMPIDAEYRLFKLERN